jgi:hypothetical protein
MVTKHDKRGNQQVMLERQWRRILYNAFLKAADTLLVRLQDGGCVLHVYRKWIWRIIYLKKIIKENSYQKKAQHKRLLESDADEEELHSKRPRLEFTTVQLIEAGTQFFRELHPWRPLRTGTRMGQF